MRVLVAIVVLTTLSPLAAQAQPTLAPGPITLEQAMELAEARSEAIALARTGIQRAEGEQVRAKSGLFPQLSVSLSYDRALASEFDGVFDNVSFGEPAEPDPDAPADGGLEDLPFGRANTWRINLNLSQNIWDFGRIRSQRELATVGRESALIGLTTSRAQVLYEVTQAYYNAALATRLVTIAEATVSQASATLQQAQAAFDAGTQPEFEVLRARVNRDTQNPILIRQRVNHEVALLRLKQMLDLPADYELQLADTLSDESAAPPTIFASHVLPIEAKLGGVEPVQATIRSPSLQLDRAAVKQVESNLRLRETSLELVKAQRLPSIALTSNYGRVAYPTNFAPTFDRVNWTVGVNMQVPILTGGRQKGDELVAAAELETARLQLRQTEELASLDTRAAVAELIAARAAWESTAGTVQQANRAYEIADVRYQAGVSTQLELSDSRLLLQQAEANRALAGRDLQVARARVALLPDLPIGVGGTPGGAQQQTAPQQQQTQPAAPSGTGQLRNASAQGGAPQVGVGQ